MTPTEQAEKLLESFALNGKITKQHADEIVAALAAFGAAQRKEGEIPMGVSQWLEHGRKYGYAAFFEDKLKKEGMRGAFAVAADCIEMEHWSVQSESDEQKICNDTVRAILKRLQQKENELLEPNEEA